MDSIVANHSWATLGTATADITVNGDYNGDYVVVVYLENPLHATSLTELFRGQAKSGETISPSFSYLLAQRTVYIAVYDKNGSRVVRSAHIDDDNHISASFFGEKADASRTTRAVESATKYPDYVKTLDDYLNPENTGLELKRVSISEMKGYTAFTEKHLAIHNTLSNGYNFPVGDFHHYRVAAGTEITSVFHINAAYGVYNDAVIYIEGKVHLKGNTLNGPTLVVADGGEIIIDSITNMSNAGRIIVMEGGKISGSNNTSFAVNNAGLCYNAGTIEYNGELNVNGTDFYNKGTIKVDVLRNTSGGKFTNFGKIIARTNIGAADSYNSQIINGCYMQYTGNAGIGKLTMLDDSRLDVGGQAEFNQDVQTLYNRSVINAGSLYVNATTFMGTDNTSEYAIIKTEKIYFAGNIYINQNKDDLYQNERYTYIARKYTGKSTIYLDWDDSETYEKDGSQCTLDNGYTMLSVVRGSEYNYISEDTAPASVSIDEGDCTGAGYSGGSGNIPKSNPLALRYCFEDNYPSPGDYDFNDCVITVTPQTNVDGNASKVTLTVSLDAVGATKQIAGVLHIKGLSRDQVSSISSDTDLDWYGLPNHYDEDSYLVPASDNGSNVQEVDPSYMNNPGYYFTDADVLIRLFEDAHWTISQTTNSYGDVQRYFYNTVDKENDYQDKVNDLPSAEVTYTFILKDSKDANLFTEANIDVFIIEKHNSIRQEVHIKPFKEEEDRVFNFTQPAMFTGDYVWAICVPGSFLYPIEWHSISGERGYGYTNAVYPKFTKWLQGNSDADQWYTEPVDSLVYQ